MQNANKNCAENPLFTNKRCIDTDDRIALDDKAIAADIKHEMARSWLFYRDKAFGHDRIKPVSGTYSEFFFDDHPLGLTIVEALDTLYIMGLDRELAEGIDWIDNNLDFNVDGFVKVFETNIRVVGGLLSGYLATGQKWLLALARDVAERLMPAFEQSPTGLPYRYVNLKTRAVQGRQVPLAELGTYIAEFGTLSELTGEPRYYRAAKNALKAVYSRRSALSCSRIPTASTTPTTTCRPKAMSCGVCVSPKQRPVNNTRKLIRTSRIQG